MAVTHLSHVETYDSDAVAELQLRTVSSDLIACDGLGENGILWKPSLPYYVQPSRGERFAVQESSLGRVRCFDVMIVKD